MNKRQAIQSNILKALASVFVEKRGSAHLVIREGVGDLITEYGEFKMMIFDVSDRWGSYHVVYKGNFDEEKQMPIWDTDHILLRIDSGCDTGQKFFDLTCDCRQQLALAMQRIGANGSGMIIHIPNQDGRGWGLPFKLATMSLQKQLGMDTVEAAETAIKELHSSDPVDIRTYGGVQSLVEALGIPKGVTIKIMSNNPDKAEIFKSIGYKTEMIPTVIDPNPYTEKHLRAKQEKLHHKNLI